MKKTLSPKNLASLLCTGGISAVLSVMSISSTFAAGWDMANNPNYFNRPYNPGQYNYNLSQLPLSGQVDAINTPWSDSYWPKQRGAFSYRWRQFQSETENQTMTMQDRQDKFFSYRLYSKNELKSMSADQIAMLSPMEKYSIYTGDYGYSLTKKYLNGKGNGPGRVSWEGYCHAWAPASSHYTEPAPKTVINRDGITIPFGSGDVKALLVANYHEAMFPGLFGSKAKRSYIGGSGCATNISFMFPTTKTRNGLEEMADYSDTEGLLDSELEDNVRAYQEGMKRVLATNPNSITLPQNARAIAYDTSLPAKARKAATSPGCMGVNAGTFHLVMANQLGIMKRGFELDKTRDGQIWNQPARGFTSKIVGYENPTANSAPGTAKVALVESSLEYGQDSDYGWTFWYPTLTNLFRIDNNFLNEYARYMKMLINVGDESEAKAYPYNVLEQAHYKYKLELDASGKIIGGEWLTLDRPDTLWIMETLGFEGNFQSLRDIYTPAQMN